MPRLLIFSIDEASFCRCGKIIKCANPFDAFIRTKTQLFGLIVTSLNRTDYPGRIEKPEVLHDIPLAHLHKGHTDKKVAINLRNWQTPADTVQHVINRVVLGYGSLYVCHLFDDDKSSPFLNYRATYNEKIGAYRIYYMMLCYKINAIKIMSDVYKTVNDKRFYSCHILTANPSPVNTNVMRFITIKHGLIGGTVNVTMPVDTDLVHLDRALEDCLRTQKWQRDKASIVPDVFALIVFHCDGLLELESERLGSDSERLGSV